MSFQSSCGFQAGGCVLAAVSIVVVSRFALLGVRQDCVSCFACDDTVSGSRKAMEIFWQCVNEIIVSVLLTSAIECVMLRALCLLFRF